MQIVRVGLDLAKNVFEVCGVDARGKIVLRKRLRRRAVAPFFATLPPCVIGMEASNGAHYWARVLCDFGHEVRLISPQFVKPYVKTNKSDKNDAEATCEAVGRPTVRFVPPKSREQLTMQAVHRIRSRLVAERVGLANQIRGILSEHGIVFAKSLTQLRRSLADTAELSDEEINSRLRELINDMSSEPAALDGRIGACDRKIRAIFHTSEMCQRIGQIEGIGPITATALVAAMGGQKLLQERPLLRRLVGSGAQTAIDRGTHAVAGHQQARRSLSAHLADPRGARGALAGGPQAGSAKPMAEQAQGPPASERRRGRAGQQERPDRVEHARPRHAV
jgi:transposase